MWPQTHTHSHSAGCLEHESERKKETEEVGGGTEEEKLTYCFISVIHFESGLNQEALGGFFTVTVWLKRPINWSKKLDRKHETMNMLQWNIYTHQNFAYGISFLHSFLDSPFPQTRAGRQPIRLQPRGRPNWRLVLIGWAASPQQPVSWARGWGRRNWWWACWDRWASTQTCSTHRNNKCRYVIEESQRYCQKAQQLSIHTHRKWAWEEMHQRKRWWWKWLMCSNDFMIWMNYKYLIDLVVSCFETSAAVNKSMLKIRKHF